MLDQLKSFWQNNYQTIIVLAREIIASVIVIVIGIVITKGFKRLLKKAASSDKSRLDNTVSSILGYIVSYGILIICIIMVLNIFGVNTTSLLAVLGAAGIAVGLALKDTLGNFAAGIILFFLGSYKIGEFIEFDIYMGTVKEINLFTTTLETPDGVYISAPNSSIWGNPLKNYSRNGKRRMEIFIRISYSDSIDTAFNVLNEIISSESRFLKEPSPQVVVQSMQDGSVNIVLRAWADNNDYWDIYNQQMRVLKQKVEEAGLHIPFPQQDIRIVQSPYGA